MALVGCEVRAGVERWSELKGVARDRDVESGRCRVGGTAVRQGFRSESVRRQVQDGIRDQKPRPRNVKTLRIKKERPKKFSSRFIPQHVHHDQRTTFANRQSQKKIPRSWKKDRQTRPMGGARPRGRDSRSRWRFLPPPRRSAGADRGGLGFLCRRPTSAGPSSQNRDVTSVGGE